MYARSNLEVVARVVQGCECPVYLLAQRNGWNGKVRHCSFLCRHSSIRQASWRKFLLLTTGRRRAGRRQAHSPDPRVQTCVSSSALPTTCSKSSPSFDAGAPPRFACFSATEKSISSSAGLTCNRDLTLFALVLLSLPLPFDQFKVNNVLDSHMSNNEE